MKRDVRISLSLFLALGLCIAPHLLWANNVDQAQSSHANSTSALHEAAQMVVAPAWLKNGIDARKTHPGQRFQAVLDRTIQLHDGTTLDKGAELLGRVTTDQTKAGIQQLALRFTRAQLKDGRSIPIKATVLEVAGPAGEYGYNLADDSMHWDHKTLRVDQIKAFRDVDMHSRIAGKNSALFVAQQGKDVKLGPLSQMLLAITARPSAQQSNMKGGI